MKRKSQKKRASPIKFKPVSTNCLFCKEGKEPDYKNYTDLAKFMTDRAKIISKARTGVCAKHQRRLGVAIKRARHLGLLPFAGSI
jgi:small subunit ribosomal protein S18